MSFLFDPFNDYTAREMRNGLSSAFVTDLQEGSLHHVHAVVHHFNSLSLEPVYQSYMDERLQAYQRVVQTIREDRLTDPLVQALVLWDAELFFEVHEWLELLWLEAAGDLKMALQALIRCAGVYVHLQRNNRPAALSMAEKALAGLEQFGGELGSITTVLPTLRAALHRPETPPLLYGLQCHE